MKIKNKKADNGNHVETITLGGGCFWCIEAAFEEIEGVIDVESGYSGGKIEKPTYEQVCTGNSGHAEVVQIRFDPNVISLKDILKIFFTIHDPTTHNRQGADVGSQYRSVIFYHNERQKKITKEIIAEFETEKIWGSPIVTQIEPFKGFYKAEGYHRKYFRRHPEAAYCRAVIAPKIAKLREKYRKKLKKT